MVDWRTVPIPERMAHLEKDRRGYPIPHVVLREVETGKPQFVVNDLVKVADAAARDLCHICGTELDRAWFVGGPGSALLNVGYGRYTDGPMHHECMRYAMQVCPYLAARQEVFISDAVGEALAERDDLRVFEYASSMPGLPDLFVCVEGEYSFSRGQFLVKQPYRRVEYWKNGELLPKDKGARQALRAAIALAKKLEEQAKQ